MAWFAPLLMKKPPFLENFNHEFKSMLQNSNEQDLNLTARRTKAKATDFCLVACFLLLLLGMAKPSRKLPILINL